MAIYNVDIHFLTLLANNNVISHASLPLDVATVVASPYNVYLSACPSSSFCFNCGQKSSEVVVEFFWRKISADYRREATWQPTSV